ncbi:MAG: DNA repair protein RadC [Chlorobium sp.]|nr:MAG: DNA repair protein RadC [Chlorobium sp.]
MTSSSMNLFGERAERPSFPRFSIKLVKESKVFYSQKKISNAKMVCELVMCLGLHEKASEEFHAIYLTTKHEVIGIEMISRGTLNATLTHPREVFKGALLANAHAIILAHNHPSGNLEPSVPDKHVTETLVQAGKILDIKVLDHVIVGTAGGFYSFMESGQLSA